MIPAVADATVLIYLAKLDRLEVLFQHHDPVFVPEPVCDKAVREGKEEGHADAVIIQEAVDEGRLTRTKPPLPPSSLKGLGLTDGDGFVLAVTLDGFLQALDGLQTAGYPDQPQPPHEGRPSSREDRRGRVGMAGMRRTTGTPVPKGPLPNNHTPGMAWPSRGLGLQ